MKTFALVILAALLSFATLSFSDSARANDAAPVSVVDAAPAVPTIDAAAPVTTVTTVATVTTVSSTTAATIKPPATPSEFVSGAQDIVSAIKDGRIGLALALLLILFVGVARNIGWPEFFKSKIGGWTLNFVGALGGAIVTVEIAGTPLTPKLFFSSVMVALSAAGLYELYSDLKAWWTKKTPA